MPATLPTKPSLEQLKNQAKDLLRACQSGDPAAAARAHAHLPRLRRAPASPADRPALCLMEAQHVVAQEYGFPNWDWLRAVVDVDFDLVARITGQETQNLLREVEQKDLVRALSDASTTTTDWLLSNMSVRVRQFIAEEAGYIRAAAGDPSDVARAAQRRILQQVVDLAAQGQINWPAGDPPPVSAAVDATSEPALLATIRRPLEDCSLEEVTDLAAGLAEQARRLGVLSLEAVAADCASALLREGLQLLVDGTEPRRIAQVLQTRHECVLLPLRRTLGRMVIAGMECLTHGDSPMIARRMVAAHYAVLPSNESANSPCEVRDLAKHLSSGLYSRLTPDALADLLTGLAACARRDSVAALGSLAETVDWPLLRLGLRRVAEGTPINELRGQLEACLEDEVRHAATRDRMMILALRSIQDGDAPDVIRTALRQVAAG